MDLTPAQKDALTELVNIGLGRAAAILNDMASSHVILSVPVVEIFSLKNALSSGETRLNMPFSSVKMVFDGTLGGSAFLIFPPESALRLVCLLTGEDRESPDLDSLKMETLNEVGNIVLNGVLGSISNAVEGIMSYTIPSYLEDTFERLFTENVDKENTVILAVAEFIVEEQNIHGDVMLVFNPESFTTLLRAIALENGDE